MTSGAQVEDLEKTVEADSSGVRSATEEAATQAFTEGAAPAVVRTAGPERPIVAGYHVVRLVGQGGMGVVWEALDQRLGRSVALKVRAGNDEETTTDALWVEARLAAKIAHPGIVPIHEVGVTATGQPYYTMDLVDGTSLRALLRDGPVPKRRALAIARSVAEAVGAAHARGVVHCDLKPGNIVLDAEGRARVLDFGLAFTLSGRGGDAQEPLRGSPPYMSPEQIAGEPLTAATDVYSLGVALYEMLTGSLPFQGATAEDMLAAITLNDPEPPSKRSDALGPEIDRLCLACLDKRAGQRPQDGRALAREIGKVLEGAEEPAEIAAAEYVPRRMSSRPPAPPPEAPHGVRTYKFEARLASPPSKLWPFVSNTERFNRAVGLPSVTFVEMAAPRGAARKSGQFRVLGMDVAWEEHPFEWVHEREHTVFRRYTKGPLAWLRNRVTLAPRDDGGTDLVHAVEAAPRGAIGVLAALWEIEWKLGRKLRAVYERMDAAARDGAAAEDPFEPPHEPSPAQRERVALGISRLGAAGRGEFPRGLLERLRDALLLAPDKRLERMRPFALADAWGAPRAEVLDLLLYAANAGLVDVAWDLLCPRCHVAHEVAPSLRQVAEQGACDACGESYTRDLVGSVELIFRPHREVRDIATATYCTGSPAMRPHVIAQQALAPRERREITVRMPRDELLVRVERRPVSAEIAASPAGLSSACEVRLGAEAMEATPSIVRAGDVRIALVNDTEAHQVFRVERPPRKADSVTAAAAMTHPTFHGFFSEELLPEGEHLRVSHVAFVAVDLEDRARVLRDLGDAGAFARFSELCARVTAAAEREQGVIARPGFDAILAAFSSSAAAVRAALAIASGARDPLGASRSPSGSASERPAASGVRIAVHAGRCIAVSRGARVEYFGETIERTAAHLADARDGVVAVSSAVDDDPGALAAMLAPGFERTVGTSRAGEYSGRRVTRLARAGG